MYVTITILDSLEFAWCVSLTEILVEKHLKSSDYLDHIEGPLATLSEKTTLWFLQEPSCKGNLLTKVGWIFQAQIIT